MRYIIKRTTKKNFIQVSTEYWDGAAWTKTERHARVYNDVRTVHSDLLVLTNGKETGQQLTVVNV